eukprot:scaffold1377_cov126-Cylindrotheca_fusiformis.AAC.9
MGLHVWQQLGERWAQPLLGALHLSVPMPFVLLDHMLKSSSAECWEDRNGSPTGWLGVDWPGDCDLAGRVVSSRGGGCGKCCSGLSLMCEVGDMLLANRPFCGLANRPLCVLANSPLCVLASVLAGPWSPG